MRRGDKGEAVRAWQLSLAARGYKLTADGDFGPATHNATLAFQAGHGLRTTGVVGHNELQIMAAPRSASIRPPPTLAFSIPLVLARNYGKHPRAVIDLIVLHSMECPEASTRAETCAQWMASDKAPMASAHYFVDSDSVVQGVPDHLVAYHAPGANHNSIGIEHAGYARQSRAEWLDEFGVRMLWLSAQLAARKCHERGIPPVFVPAAELRKRGARGITTHHEVSQAFGKSDHHDPGPGFPMDHYLGQVELALSVLAGVS